MSYKSSMSSCNSFFSFFTNKLMAKKKTNSTSRYIDGFVIPVPRTKLASYKRMASAAGKVWMEYGALEYYECAGDDLESQWGLSFTKLAKTKPDETVVFSFIIYASKADRNRINKKVMSDERINKMMEQDMPFDVKRMANGGFKSIVQL